MQDTRDASNSQMREHWPVDQALIERYPVRPRRTYTTNAHPNRNLIKRIHALKIRLRGPGGLYNLGNAIALATGISVQLASVRPGSGYLETIESYFFGSPGATWLTFAVLVFFVGGEVYHRAWVGRAVPDLRLNGLGDLLSGIGALLLTMALAHTGDILLAIVAGTLLAGGKLGSAALPSLRLKPKLENSCDRVMRASVVASRLPSILALGVELFTLSLSGMLWSTGIMPGVMLLCVLIWMAADILLLRIPATNSATRRATDPE